MRWKRQLLYFICPTSSVILGYSKKFVMVALRLRPQFFPAWRVKQTLLSKWAPWECF